MAVTEMPHPENSLATERMKSSTGVLPEFPLTPFSAYAVYPTRDFLPQKVRLFIEKMRERLLQART